MQGERNTAFGVLIGLAAALGLAVSLAGCTYFAGRSSGAREQASRPPPLSPLRRDKLRRRPVPRSRPLRSQAVGPSDLTGSVGALCPVHRAVLARASRSPPRPRATNNLLQRRTASPDRPRPPAAVRRNRRPALRRHAPHPQGAHRHPAGHRRRRRPARPPPRPQRLRPPGPGLPLQDPPVPNRRRRRST